MKQIVKTVSGSTYVIDVENLRWERSSDHEIVGAPGLGGERLAKMPDITIGERMMLLAPSGTWVSTSAVAETWTEE